MKITFVIGLTFNLVLLQSVNCIHLPLPPLQTSESLSRLQSELEKSSDNSTIKTSNNAGNINSSSIDSDSSPDSATNVKGNVNSIMLPDFQSTIQDLIQKLNSTISSLTSNTTSGFSSIIGTVKNLTSSIMNKGRLLEDDVGHLTGNISEILREAKSNTSRSSDSESKDHLANLTSALPNEVEGALRDFHKSILELKRAAVTFPGPGQNSSSSLSSIERRSGENQVIPRQETTAKSPSSDSSSVSGKADSNANATGRQNGKPGMRQDGLRRIWEKVSELQGQVDRSIQQSLSDARIRLEDSISNTAKQGSQLMRNQTAGFMNEIRRMFSTFSEPIRQFLDDVRRRTPTAVVTA